MKIDLILNRKEQEGVVVVFIGNSWAIPWVVGLPDIPIRDGRVKVELGHFLRKKHTGHFLRNRKEGG